MWIYILAIGLALLAGYLIWLQVSRPKTGAQAASKAPEKKMVELPEKREQNEVIIYELTEEDIPAIIEKEPDLVILVFAPWCGYCKKMAPEFVKAAGLKPKCTWARLNAEEFPEAAKKLGADSFPTTFHFKNGKMEKALPGAMTADKLVNQVVQ